MREQEPSTRRHALRGLLTETIDEWSVPSKSTQASMRTLMGRLDSEKASHEHSTPLLKGSLAIPSQPTPVKRAISPSLLALVHSMTADLAARASTLLTLNPSRRDAIAAHLEKLSGLPGSQKTALADWVNGPKSQTEKPALLSFFEEVAVMTLSQALLLKRWSDRGLRQFQPANIGKLNWELSSALRPHVPLHRESWHITRPNLYSWYNPSTQLQEEIWKTLEGMTLAEESPRFLLDLCTEGRRFAPDWPTLIGYDTRFYSGVWSQLPKLGVELGPTMLGRKRSFYSPTLRFGEMTHGSPESVQWIGFESSCFQLLICELIELWWGPKAPPTWAQGNSLEAHPREQLCFTPANAKPNVLQNLIEMEACEMGFVVEERGVKASKWKAQLDEMPFYKKLRSPNTSLGTLQACVAITKIRPGGKLLWIREEPITQEEGSEALNFILGRAKLISEANLSEVEHALPTKCPLYPRYLYLFEREIDHEARFSHRPYRVHLQGSLKSHIEIPLLIGDAIASLSGQTGVARANWKIHVQQSPMTQKEWASRWPDPASVQAYQAIETLQDQSIPLATLGTVRTVAGVKPGSGDACGILITSRENPRGIETRSLSQIPAGSEIEGTLLILSDESAVAPLQAYLESPSVHQWVEHHAERRGDHWKLTDSLVKFIPVPKRLHEVLSAKRDADYEGCLQAVVRDPSEAALSPARYTWLKDRWKKHVVLAQSRIEIERAKSRLNGMISTDGRVEWASLIQIFSKNDCISLTSHTMVKLQGSLPVNSPIVRIERLKAPQSGVLLMNEAGAVLKVLFDHRMICEIAWDQMKGLKHPTWGEIVHWVRLPRFLEVAETAAQDLLKTYAEIERKRAKVGELLAQNAL